MTHLRALISLGTNSTRLLIVRDEDGGCIPLYHQTRGTRLGAGLRAGGTIAPEAAERTLAAVSDYAQIARERGAGVDVIATSAMRRADDAAEFAARIAERAGAPVQIIEGTEEARLSFVGATLGHGEIRSPVGVLDVGGGSCEYAFGLPRDPATIRSYSTEIGAVRAAERFPEVLGARALDEREADELERAMREVIAGALAALRDLPVPAALYGVGGTVMTVAAIVTNRPREEANNVVLGREDLGGLARRLVRMSHDERLTVPRMNAQRADILPAGLFIVDEACAALRVDRLESSFGDLLLGYLFEHRPSPRA